MAALIRFLLICFLGSGIIGIPLIVAAQKEAARDKKNKLPEFSNPSLPPPPIDIPEKNSELWFVLWKAESTYYENEIKRCVDSDCTINIPRPCFVTQSELYKMLSGKAALYKMEDKGYYTITPFKKEVIREGGLW